MSRRSPNAILVHVVWATRSRRRLICRADDERLASLLRQTAADLGCKLIAIGNAADHVHVVARIAPTIALADLVQRLKGRSSYVAGWRWQAGYFAESIGIADLGPLSAYVEHQRRHHDASHPAESWIMRDWEPAEGGL